MLDINYILENKERVARAIKEKQVKLDLDELIAVDTQRRSVIKEIEDLNRQRNEHASRIKQSGKPDAQSIAEGKRLKDLSAKLEPELRTIERNFMDLMMQVPNVYAEGTPVGSDDTGNVAIRSWGTPRTFDFTPQDHIQLGTQLDLIDTERGAKAAGFRGYYLKNDLALLHWAVLTYALHHMANNGFRLMITPSLVNEIGLIGSGWFPAGKDEVYAVDDQFLSGTAEVALLAYHADEILDESQLPLRYCGFSPCFRREAGSYGKDTKGLYRLHEFWKVEQVVVMNNDLAAAQAMFETMLGFAETMLQDLGLPYRVLQICTGDMGAGKYTMCDIETWMPSRHAYSETHSCSLLTDWQSRRLNTRYRDASGKVMYPFTLNNTVIASPRILIALMENYQRADGSIDIPEKLRPYMNGVSRITRQ